MFMQSVLEQPSIQRYSVPGPKARAILERDSTVVSPAYGREHPFVMSHGRGSEVWDVDGNRYLDFVAGIAVNSTGHSHPHVVDAVKAQADKFLHISSDFYHEQWVELSERLGEIAPFDEPARIFLGNSGTEAVEAAIKLAMHHTGRHRFVGFLSSFHGRTLGSLGFTSSKTTQRAGFLPATNVTHVPYPNAYRPLLARQPGQEDYGDTVVDYLENVVFKSLLPPESVAGILVEPIQGEGGYIVPPDNFFPRLREVCDRHGIVLIVDEVQSGMGRTGKWWAIEHSDIGGPDGGLVGGSNVQPDIVCTAKGIASGVPLGAIIARESISTWGPGAHGNTYGGNPIACAAAIATLDVLANGGVDNAREQGEYLMDALAEIGARHPSIGDVRGRGLMVGVEFVGDKSTRTPSVEIRNRTNELAFEHGLLLMGCGTNATRFIPPLIVERAQVDEALQIFEHALLQAEGELL